MLSEVQRILVAAAHAEDAPARLRALVDEACRGGAEDDARAAPRLTADERAWLLAMDPDGLRVTSLLVRKLRFERVVRGDATLLRRFEDDPAAFTNVFRAYCRDVAPTFAFPEDEARAFRAYADTDAPGTG
ncbi:MAG: hypothetical protein K8T90_02030 [Planctomycetes bacterium]|nr:hypothetical protein [Planctomycetota bacterium]